jgi:hypothetical protein
MSERGRRRTFFLYSTKRLHHHHQYHFHPQSSSSSSSSEQKHALDDPRGARTRSPQSRELVKIARGQRIKNVMFLATLLLSPMLVILTDDFFFSDPTTTMIVVAGRKKPWLLLARNNGNDETNHHHHSGLRRRAVTEQDVATIVKQLTSQEQQTNETAGLDNMAAAQYTPFIVNMLSFKVVEQEEHDDSHRKSKDGTNIDDDAPAEFDTNASEVPPPDERSKPDTEESREE